MLHELIAHGIKPSELKTKDGYNKHIHLDGSREHVLSYSNKGVHCSNKNCIVNADNQSHCEDTIYLDANIGKVVFNRISKIITGEIEYKGKLTKRKRL